ncbi:kinase RLK-Pelle-CrRLK1L-1 family protein, partial [Tanacetum coccineum]
FPSYVFNGKSSFELVYGLKLKLSHLRSFGCLCFLSVLNNSDKFSASPNDVGSGNYAPLDEGSVYPCTRSSQNFDKSEDDIATSIGKNIPSKGIVPSSSGLNTHGLPAIGCQVQHAIRRSSRPSKIPPKFNDYVVRSNSKFDYSLSTKNSVDVYIDLFVYVDDIVITGNNLSEIEKFKMFLKSKFQITDLGKLKYFLSIEFMQAPLECHLNAALKVLRYLKGSPGSGIQINKNENLKLRAYADFDWARCPATRKSIDANLVFHEKSKHFEIDVRQIREKVASGVIKNDEIYITQQIDDVLIKALYIEQHKTLCDKLGLLDMFKVEKLEGVLKYIKFLYKSESDKHGISAVKQLVTLDNGLGQGNHEILTEIEMLSSCEHENIISLHEFCDEGGEKILVYKLERNGSLDNHLASKDLDWIKHIQICIDAARGLQYLHDDVGTRHRILHRDIKSANNLLDENFNAKNFDFGLSIVGPANVQSTFITTTPCGTFGYIDPEYYTTSHFTQKSDIFSFAVVLFEVLCGRIAYLPRYQDNRQYLSVLAQKHYKRKTLENILKLGRSGIMCIRERYIIDL